MSQTHFLTASEPKEFPSGQKYTALCGKEIQNAKPIFFMDLESGRMEAMSTIVFCTTCLQLAITPVVKKTWVYRILPAEEAHRRNLADRMEDF